MTNTTTDRYMKSQQAFQRAVTVMPGGVNSPVRAFGSVGGNPVFLSSAEGAYVTDMDSNRYVDLVGTWGPAIVGHAHPAVVEAVKQAAEKGLSFGACCEAEALLAETIVGALPSVELLRFVNSGTEAVMSAVRLARAATGREKILKFLGCYHGHSDGLLVAAGSGAATFGTPDSAGVPALFARLTLLSPYNDLEAVRQIMNEEGNEVAAIIVEPIAGNMGFVEPKDGFLQGLRDICDEHGTLLIFDEVMTGFRTEWGGYQCVCNIKPDITTLGKVIGGGMPVAAYGGSQKLMELVSPLGPMYQAGTLSGNPIGMAAGIATLRICNSDGFYNMLAEKTQHLTAGLVEVANRHGLKLHHGAQGGMFGFAISKQPIRNYNEAAKADHKAYGRFFHAMLNLGVWLPPSGYESMFISMAHTTHDLDQVIEAADSSFAEIY